MALTHLNTLGQVQLGYHVGYLPRGVSQTSINRAHLSSVTMGTCVNSRVIDKANLTPPFCHLLKALLGPAVPGLVLIEPMYVVSSRPSRNGS